MLVHRRTSAFPAPMVSSRLAGPESIDRFFVSLPALLMTLGWIVFSCAVLGLVLLASHAVAGLAGVLVAAAVIALCAFIALLVAGLRVAEKDLAHY